MPPLLRDEQKDKLCFSKTILCSLLFLNFILLHIIFERNDPFLGNWFDNPLVTHKCIYKVRAIHYFESGGASKKLPFCYYSECQRHETRGIPWESWETNCYFPLVSYLRDSSYRALRLLSGKPMKENSICHKTRHEFYLSKGPTVLHFTAWQPQIPEMWVLALFSSQFMLNSTDKMSSKEEKKCHPFIKRNENCFQLSENSCQIHQL